MKILTQKIQMLLILLFFMQPFFAMAQTNQYLHFDREDDFVLPKNRLTVFFGNK